jgi:NTE family protein
MKIKIHNCLAPVLLITAVVGYGCAHYPINQPQTVNNPQWTEAKKADEITLFLTFSGGGTRAAAFSYGVLEELADRKITINGKETRLLDEVSVISSVSGGSFTAAYYGLFGDRIFTDFEPKFLKKNIQGRLISRTFFNPVSWARLASPGFNMSDLAAEYYDDHIFEKGKIGDMVRRGGPAIVINATDMVSGLRVDFTGEMFDVICSDLWNYPVARAVAASSAVPGILAPVRLRNYASTCNYKRRENIETLLQAENDTEDITNRRAWILRNAIPYLDSGKKKYIHLLDGGIADNLGVRAMMDRIMLRERNLAESIQSSPLEHTKKFIFIIVNAETEPDSIWNKTDAIPTIVTMIGSYSTIAIQRYNVETLALLKESLNGWSDQIRAVRCTNGKQPDDRSCENIQFYIIYVGFNALKDEKEREYFNHIPTSFSLEPEQVDKLRAAARKILGQSKEFQRLLQDVGKQAGPSDRERGPEEASLHNSE